MNAINPATRPRDELNEFTFKVNELFRPENEYGRSTWHVRLRDGTLVQPEFKEAEDTFCEDLFFAKGFRYGWNLDGTSVARFEYDMMEIVRK
jgi:hypothetical protein